MSDHLRPSVAPLVDLDLLGIDTLLEVQFQNMQCYSMMVLSKRVRMSVSLNWVGQLAISY